MVWIVLEAAKTNAQAVKKPREIIPALKSSVHSFFNREEIKGEMKSAVAPAQIGIKSARIPATASFFWERPIVTFEPAEIRNFDGFVTSIPGIKIPGSDSFCSGVTNIESLFIAVTM